MFNMDFENNKSSADIINWLISKSESWSIIFSNTIWSVPKCLDDQKMYTLVFRTLIVSLISRFSADH